MVIIVVPDLYIPGKYYIPDIYKNWSRYYQNQNLKKKLNKFYLVAMIYVCVEMQGDSENCVRSK